MTNEEANFIMHAGVKGMKWGQRRRARDERITTARRLSEGVRTKLSDSERRFESAKSTASMLGLKSTRQLELAKFDRAKAFKEYAKFDRDTLATSSSLKSGEIAAIGILSVVGATAYTLLGK